MNEKRVGRYDVRMKESSLIKKVTAVEEVTAVTEL